MTVVKYDNPPVKDCFGVDSELCLLEAGRCVTNTKRYRVSEKNTTRRAV